MLRRCAALCTLSALASLLLVPASPAAAFRASFSANTLGSATLRVSAGNATTTLAITTTVAAPAGSVVVVSGAANNTTGSTPTFTVADSADNTYTTRLQGCGGPGAAAGDGVCGFVATARVGSQLVIGSTITVTLSVAQSRIAVNAQFFSGVSDTFRASAVSATANILSTTPSATVATVNTGDIVVGVAAVEDGSNTLTVDSDTTNGTWATNTLAATSNGAGSTEVMANTQYKEATAAGTQTYNITTTSTDNWTAIFVLNRMATPEAVTNLAATPGNAQVDLSWTAAASNDSPITDYVVEYKLASSGTWLTFADGTSATAAATVTGLTNGSLYDFRVTGVNAIGTSDIAAPTVQSTPRTVPTAPTNVAGTPQNTQVALTWTAPSSDGGNAVSDYTVEFSSNGGTSWSTFSDGVSTATSATVTGLVNGTAYVFRVSAVNAAGTGAASSNSSSTTPRTVPTAPTSVSASATAASKSMTITWSAPTSDGGAGISGYTVIDQNGSTVCTTAGATTCTVASLVSNTSYAFLVFATNVAGNSANSVASSSTLQTSVPGAPTSLRLVSARYRFIVDWTAPADNGFALTGYTATATNGSTTRTCTVSAASTRCIISGFPSSQSTFTVTVRATNVYGSSAASDSVSAPTWFTPQRPQQTDLRTMDLSGLDLTNVNLTGALLIGANLEGASFAGATLTGLVSSQNTGTPSALPTGFLYRSGAIVGPGVHLSFQNLSGADLSGLTIANLNFANANLSGANFANSTFTNANFTNANLSNATFSSTNLTGATFAGANLAGAQLASATLTRTRSGSVAGTPASLPARSAIVGGFIVSPRVLLINANLAAADLSGLDLTGVNLTGATLTGANLSSITAASGTTFLNATLTGANFANASVTATPFTGATLSGGSYVAANFNGASMTSVMMQGANFTNANFTNANLTNASVSTANLTNALFSGSTLTGTDLSSATLARLRSTGVVGTPTLPAGAAMVHGFVVAPGVNLSGADLRGRDLGGLDLTGTLLVGANLHGTKFDNANVLRTNFKDASVNASTSFASTSGRPAVLPSGHRWANNGLQKI